MRPPGIATAAALLLCFAAALHPRPASAERADQDKPIQIEANRMNADEIRRLTVFEGDVALNKGTLSVRADRIVVRQDADGFQHATATGEPARFRQKTDPRDGEPGVWIEAEAERIVLDDRNEKIELFDKARVMRDKDEMRGDYILLDQRSESFTVSGGKEGQPGRVQVIIQPKAQPSTPAPAEKASPPAAPGGSGAAR
jgi:lipopolysaccharide export system protein LptA